MRENYELIKKEIGEIKALCMTNMFDESMLMEMGPDELKLMQSTLRLIDTTLKFTETQVASMERIESKLDELLMKE